MNKKTIYFVILGFLAFQSCEKVIEIELNDSEKKYALEGELRDGISSIEVNISKTVAYLSGDEKELLNNASVQITDELGTNILLISQGNGRYSQDVNFVANQHLYLSIVLEGIEYKANSFLPKKVEINELILIQDDNGKRNLAIGFMDPIDEENYYMIRYKIDDELKKEDRFPKFVIFTDQNFNGTSTNRKIIQKDYLRSGEEVTIELISISENTYNYYSGMNSLLSSRAGGGSAAPGNPESNWSGDALGFFSTLSISSKSIVIP